MEGKLGDPYLKMRYKFALFMPTPRLIHSSSTRIYRSGTKKLVKLPVIESIYLNIPQ